MKNKYYRYTLKGDHTLGEAQRALGDAAAQSTVVRVDSGGGQTKVYVAGGGATAAKGAKAAGGQKAATTAAGVKVEEVSESEVLKLG